MKTIASSNSRARFQILAFFDFQLFVPAVNVTSAPFVLFPSAIRVSASRHVCICGSCSVSSFPSIVAHANPTP